MPFSRKEIHYLAFLSDRLQLTEQLVSRKKLLRSSDSKQLLRESSHVEVRGQYRYPDYS